MKEEKKIINDEVDIPSLLSILFDNINFIFSVFLVSFFTILIFYIASPNIYQSQSLIEIKDNNQSFLPTSLTNNIGNFTRGNSLDAEIEIYKSFDTISGALERLEESHLSHKLDENLTSGAIRSNLILNSDFQTLINIKLNSKDKELGSFLLNLLNEEFISDRVNFIKESSAAGRKFVINEIPRIKKLLKEAEDNLNDFKVSTNIADVILDTNTRNSKLERLKNRINEIEFKELELKEFYKTNHPIYLTLTQQKDLVQMQINEIEKELPTVPSTQRALENFKREVDIYSNVLKELSSQEISLGMAEAASTSNVRIINDASEGVKISPRILIFILVILIPFFIYIFLVIRHFISDKITNLDALSDFLGKEKIIGEMPYLTNINSPDSMSAELLEELFNKAAYEITHRKDGNFMAIVSTKKGAGKTEISKRLFNKLKVNNKVCLIDLDYRKKGLTKEFSQEKTLTSFDEFYESIDEFKSDNESIFIPSFEIDNPTDYFSSNEFESEINKLKEKYDYIICDTPPWSLFVDAKIIAKHFESLIFIVSNRDTSFKEIISFEKEIHDMNSIKYFYNKFDLFFNFLWIKYQYPSYARNYYYDYSGYSSFRKDLRITYFKKLSNFLKISFFKKLIKSLRRYFN